MIQREQYLHQLADFKDTNVIKVVTGIRRCGKSTLFDLYEQNLLAQGIAPEQIVRLNFEDLAFEELLDYKKLYKYLLGHLCPGKTTYIFLDEVQSVEQFQKVIDSLQLRKDVDLYITGSNAYLLSGELATLLSGRYVEIKMQPLSFKEYLSALPPTGEISRRFADYLVDSSFPGALEFKQRAKVREYLGGIYHTIVMKDVAARLRVSDILMLESLIKYMFDNIGNLTSTRRISETMTQDGRTISVHTVEKYLSGLLDSYILYRVPRYDVKGRQLLRTGDKYYVADAGLRRYLLGGRATDDGRILENVVYLELLRRGYEVYVGKVGAAEVDFVARKGSDVTYYQVALTVREESTLRRELAALDAIKDHHPKILLTRDDDPPADYNGIKKLNVLNWLTQ